MEPQGQGRRAQHATAKEIDARILKVPKGEHTAATAFPIRRQATPIPVGMSIQSASS